MVGGIFCEPPLPVVAIEMPVEALAIVIVAAPNDAATGEPPARL